MTTDRLGQPVASGHDAKIFVSLELSKSSWGIVLFRPSRGKFSHHEAVGGDGPGLIAFLHAQQRLEVAQLGGPVRIISCYEAGRDAFWLDRALRASGIENHVFDPASLLVTRRAKQVKTDRVDGEGLLRTLMALDRGETKVVSLVCVPSVAVEDERRLTRERDRLVREHTQHRNRITALLFTQGVRDVQLARPDWADSLDRLHTGDGRVLPPRLVAELRREATRLALVDGQIKAVETEMAQSAKAQASQAVINRLRRLQAIGPVRSAVLAGEVFSHDFANRRCIASFVGLAPVPWASGQIDRSQGIAKTGNGRVRTAMIELAWSWLRYQPASVLSQWFQARVGTTKGRIRRIAIVALARKLLVALWRYVTQGVIPEGAKLRAI